jgi:hypothetical protein
MKLILVAVVAPLFIRWNIGIIETKAPATNNLLTAPVSGVAVGP